MAIIKVQDDCRTGRTSVSIFGLKFSYINQKLVTRPDYCYPLSKIREKYKNKQKVRVGFLVNENCKWNAEDLYNLLENNENFEPIVLVTLYDTRHNKKDFTKPSVQDNFDFFKNSGKRVLKVYDEEKEKYLDLKEFDIDILFYQQPWGLDKIQSIENVAKNSICCYFSYGIGIFECAVNVRPFHEKLFYYFVSDEATKNLYKKFEINNLDNLTVVGYPKLDVYNDLPQTPTAKTTVIYAPHHSYKRGLKIGTFDKTGEQILAFAKVHPEYRWVFKPHPDLKEVLYTDKHYGPDFTENYYSQWEEIGEIYDKGNYFGLFMASDILITDCSSFLLEYMPTLKPIIRLERLGSQKVSALGKEFLKGMYRVRNVSEMSRCLEALKQKDSLLEVRNDLTKNVLRKEKNACANIVKKLEIICTGEDVNSRGENI